MNAIQLRNRVDNLIDRTRSSRHSDEEYYNSINAAITLIVKDRVASIRPPRKYSVQSAQRIRDELYPIVVKDTTTTPTGNDVIRPADYFYGLLLYATINGDTNYCRPTTYNQIGLLADNPFKRPTTVKPYYNEYATGIKIEFGTSGTFSAYELWYVKNPAIVSIGQDRDKISTVIALTNLTVYYVYEDATYNATVTTGSGAVVTAGQVLVAGETFTATGANLLTGTVIITTKVVNTDLPLNMHEEICLRASAILEGTVEAFGKKQDLNMEVEKS